MDRLNQEQSNKPGWVGTQAQMDFLISWLSRQAERIRTIDSADPKPMRKKNAA